MPRVPGLGRAATGGVVARLEAVPGVPWPGNARGLMVRRDGRRLRGKRQGGVNKKKTAVRTCPECGGDGQFWMADKAVTCPKCKGSGRARK